MWRTCFRPTFASRDSFETLLLRLLLSVMEGGSLRFLLHIMMCLHYIYVSWWSNVFNVTFVYISLCCHYDALCLHYGQVVLHLEHNNPELQLCVGLFFLHYIEWCLHCADQVSQTLFITLVTKNCWFLLWSFSRQIIISNFKLMPQPLKLGTHSEALLYILIFLVKMLKPRSSLMIFFLFS